MSHANGTGGATVVVKLGADRALVADAGEATLEEALAPEAAA
jgi:hypothetical protein